MLYPNTEWYKSFRQLRTSWVLNTVFLYLGMSLNSHSRGVKTFLVNKHLRMKYNLCYTEKLRKK